MARVRQYPTGASAKALAATGAQITRKHGQAATTPVAIIWPDVSGKWQPATAQWLRLPYTDWQDCPDQWADSQHLWDYTAADTRTAFIRVRRTLYNQPIGAYVATAQNTRRAAVIWRTIPAPDRASWNQAAKDFNAAAYHPVIDPNNGRPRFANQRRCNGFALFATALHNAPQTIPSPPNDTTRTGEIDMTELLTGTDYEQRIISTLGNTDGVLSIVMYQVSPNWSANTISASPLFDVLLAQPVKRSQCRLILGTPAGGSNLATLNDQAAAIMAAAGWYVRRVPAYPVLHAKLWLIERGYLYAGSHNLSNRATTSNTEAGILTTNSAAVQRARAFTQGLWDAAV